MSIFDYVDIVTDNKNKTRYKVFKARDYFSNRYQKHIRIKPTDKLYDGATGAIDIDSFGWLYHDVLKRDKCFEDGSPCSNFQASMVLRDILASEGRYIR